MLFANLVTHHMHSGRQLPSLDAQAYLYVLAGDGILVRAETPLFTALVLIAACSVRGLAPPQSMSRQKVPRIPEKLLRAALRDARGARRPDGDLNELLYQFLHRGHGVQLRRPPQRATGVNVMAAGDSDPAILCQLHSHGNISALWSRTDDADEQSARVCAVIGRLDTAPEIRVRASVYDYWHPLPVRPPCPPGLNR
jgi:PRTRC genetic system protein A